MKKTTIVPIIVICLILTVSCSDRTFYDVTPPQLIFSVLTEDNSLLMQFNEPIKKLQYAVGHQIVDAVINFPKNNIFISENELNQINADTITLHADDTSGHSSEYKINKPQINNNPAELSVDTLQLRYSDKSPQKITFRSRNNGDTTGYKAIFFIRNEFIVMPMESIKMKAGQTMTLSFIPTKTEYLGCRISSRNQIISFDRCRLSPSCSAVYILDNHDTLLDYIFYIDTKKNDINYYQEKSRSYKKIFAHLSEIIESVSVTDVKGNTIRKPIVKIGEKFSVKDYIKK